MPGRFTASSLVNSQYTGAAIAALFGLADLGRKELPARILLRDLGRIIGLFQPGDAIPTESGAGQADERLAAVMDLLLELRQTARANRDFATTDRIRDALGAVGIRIKDAKDGACWEIVGG